MSAIRNSTLTRKTPLRQKQSLRASYATKVKRGEKQMYQYKPKPVNRKKYYSIFTEDLGKCIMTGSAEDIHVHHIFGGSRKWLSEKYGFLIPLRSDWHVGTKYCIHKDIQLNIRYKIECQEYYLQHYGTKEQFISEFSKYWIEEESA